MPGLSANRNTGWRGRAAPVVLFTDNDTIPVPRLVAEHLAWHERHPEEHVAVVGHVRWAKGIKVTPFMKWLDDGVQFHFGVLDGDEASWAHLYGANSSIKRSFLERVGGYDEERLPYLYEDLDWGYRAREHGLRVLYNAPRDRRPLAADDARRLQARAADARRHRVAVHASTRTSPVVSPDVQRCAVARPVARGRAGAGAASCRRGFRGLAERVWFNADVYWRQQIAPHFLASWDAALRGAPASSQPDVEALLAERSVSSAGS